MAKLIKVIVADDRRGFGVKADPIRRVTQYWSTDGDLLAEVDPCPPTRDGREADLTVEVALLRSAIGWALGEVGHFTPPSGRPPAFWWRAELRRRAGMGLA